MNLIKQNNIYLKNLLFEILLMNILLNLKNNLTVFIIFLIITFIKFNMKTKFNLITIFYY